MDNIKIENILVIKNTRTEINKQDLSELMSSIRENGLIHPISVYPIENYKFKIVCGHRRFLALKKLGRKELLINKEVKVLDSKLNNTDLLILNLSENLHRLENSPIELGNACSELKSLGLNNSEIAVRLALPKSRIETAINLMTRVPKDARKDIGYVAGAVSKKGKIPASVALNITNLRINRANTEALFKKAKKEELTVTDINTYGRLIAEGMTLKEATTAKKDYETVFITFIVNKGLREKLDADVKSVIRDIVKGKRKPMPELLY